MMSIWSKLKFWGGSEKNEFPPLPGEFGNIPSDFNQQGFGPQQPLPGMQGMNSSIDQGFQQQHFKPQQYPTFEPVQQNPIPGNVRFPGSSVQQPDFASGKDMNMEVVSAKLDALRASLESINQRLANLERVAYQDYEPPQKRGPRW